jgi:pimeloyl-ACP methyl ester carboxylesterase
MAPEAEPFRVRVEQAVLDDLRQRLQRTRWPGEIAGSGWTRGAPLGLIQRLVDYWRDEFDWRRVEERINRLRQFRTPMDGALVHFVHERGRGPRPMPLLIGHGWPGSFLEMLDLVPRLADPAGHGASADDAFDVVVPSMPGYGFSAPPREDGMSPVRIAEQWARLMGDLGYERFGAQGGDWGATVATRLALHHADRLVGIHLNYIPGSYRPDLGPGSPPPTPEEQAFLADAERWYRDEGAYAHVQATRPQTLAYGLNDSPVGLLAWIVEKLRGWADCGGDVEAVFSKDVILAHVTLYWVTGTINSANHLYYEASRAPLQLGEGQRVRVPCAIARFPKEEPMPPRSWVERGYDVRRWTEQPRGGHFAAMEQPDLLARDIRDFFRPLRSGGTT